MNRYGLSMANAIKSSDKSDVEWMSTKEAAELIGFSRQRLWVVIDKGHLPATRIGGNVWAVKREDAEKYRDTDRPTGVPIANRVDA